ncbi:hypothetical protein MTO96_022745 [Rhipicephalus appendiculatus]
MMRNFLMRRFVLIIDPTFTLSPSGSAWESVHPPSYPAKTHFASSCPENQTGRIPGCPPSFKKRRLRCLLHTWCPLSPSASSLHRFALTKRRTPTADPSDGRSDDRAAVLPSELGPLQTSFSVIVNGASSTCVLVPCQPSGVDNGYGHLFYVEKPPNVDGASYDDERCGARAGRKMRAAFGVLKQFWRLLYIVCVPLLLLPVAACIGGKAGWCAYILLWMAFYWSAEVVPLAATSLMPVFLFPLFGIVPSNKVATFYLNEIGLVLLCSLVMAGAVEISNLHKRIALRSLLAIGTSNLRLLLGFMLVTMSLSMWIPNTASTSIMAPIVMAVVDQMHTSTKSYSKDVESSDLESLTRRQEPVGKDKEKARSKDSSSAARSEEDTRHKKLRTVMLLSVAYAANIGGTGSLVGTGPNLVLKGLMDDLFPESTELTFATWMLYNAPTMLICVLIGWGYLLFSARKEMRSPSSDASAEKVREEIAARYRDLGPMSFPEWCVMFLMSSMIVLWFTMKPQMFPGWVETIPYQKMIKPSAPAMLAMFLLFVIPKDPP